MLGIIVKLVGEDGGGFIRLDAVVGTGELAGLFVSVFDWVCPKRGVKVVTAEGRKDEGRDGMGWTDIKERKDSVQLIIHIPTTPESP
jgi:hypothetical protein